MNTQRGRNEFHDEKYTALQNPQNQVNPVTIFSYLGMASSLRSIK
jgi:hypothetical protein